MPTTYSQLAGNAFTPSEIADAAATIGTIHTGSTFEIAGGGSHAGYTIRFNAAGGQTFEYNGSNEPIFGVSGQDLIGSVDLLNGATVVATFSTPGGTGPERFLDAWWTTYKAGGAKTGAADAVHGLFGATNQTGDANDNALETFGLSSTLEGNGGTDRYLVSWNVPTVTDGSGNGTVEITDLVGSVTFNMGGGTNTLIRYIPEFDAHVGDGDALSDFKVFTIGSGGQTFDLDSSFVPSDAVLNGPSGANVFLRISGPAFYNASSWDHGGYLGKVVLDASTASGAVTLAAPDVPTTLTGNGQGSANFTGGSKADTAKFNGGAANFFDGKDGTDTILLSGTPNSSIVTRTGPNSFHIAEPGGLVADVTNVENWASGTGGGSLAAVADAPDNQPPHIFSLGVTPSVRIDLDDDELKIGTVSDDHDKSDDLTITATLADGKPLPSFLGPVDIIGGEIVVGLPGAAKTGQYDIRVTIKDSGGLTTSGILTVILDDDPEFKKPSQTIKYPEGQNKGIDLNKLATDADIPPKSPPGGESADLGKVLASSSSGPPDIAHQKLVFSIIGGEDKGDFKLTDKGILKFKGGADFEHPKDKNHDNKYKVTVEVSDGFFSDEADLTIKVKNNQNAKVAEMASDHGAGHHSGDWLFHA